MRTIKRSSAMCKVLEIRTKRKSEALLTGVFFQECITDLNQQQQEIID